MSAQQWLERGANTTDPFDALSNYWRGFNNLFAGNRQERDLISDYLRARVAEDFALEVIDTHAHQVNTLIAIPVVDMRGNRKDTSAFMNQFNSSTTAIEKLVALFMIIYQVRCNFEHGQKSPSHDRDVELCTAACPFIAAVIRHTIRSDNQSPQP